MARSKFWDDYEAGTVKTKADSEKKTETKKRSSFWDDYEAGTVKTKPTQDEKGVSQPDTPSASEKSEYKSPSRGEVNRSQGKIWASGRSAKDIREAIGRIDNQIKDAKYGSIKSDLGILSGNFSNTTKNDQRIASLEASRERLRQELAVNWSALKDNADFAERSQPDAGFAAMTDDDMYRLVNYPEESNTLTDAIVRSPAELSTAVKPLTNQHIQLMTDEERQNYNYLYATEGKGSANEYLELIDAELLDRYREQNKSEAETIAAEHPVLSTAYTAAAAPVTGVLSAAGQAGTYLLTGEKLDANALYNAPAAMSEDIREAVSANLEKKWGKAGSVLYNVGTEVLDALVYRGLGFAGKSGISKALNASDAIAEIFRNATERGVDDDKAFGLAMTAGAIGAIDETINLDMLFGAKWDESTIRYLLKNFFGGAAGEGVESILNTAADILVSRDKSEWQQSVNAYLEEGFKPNEAFRYTFLDYLKTLGVESFAGGLADVTMAAGSLAIDKTVRSAVNRESKREGQETIRSAVNEQRQEDFETGSDPGYGQLMTLAQQEKADAIANAPDETTATAIKYNATKKQLEQAQALSKTTGKEIVFFRSSNTKENGYYNPNDGRIYVNVNSEQTVPTILAHELTHTLEGTKAYGELKRMIFANITRSGESFKDIWESKRETYEKAGITLDTWDGVNSEVVADYVQKHLLTNRRDIEEVWREHPSVARRIASALDRLILRAAGAEDQTDMAYLQTMRDEYERVYHDLEEEDRKNRAETVMSSETLSERRTAPQTSENVTKENIPASVSQNVSGARESSQDTELGKKLREERDRLDSQGKLSAEEYDEMTALIEEANTGADLSKSTVTVEPEIPVRKKNKKSANSQTIAEAFASERDTPAQQLAKLNEDFKDKKISAEEYNRKWQEIKAKNPEAMPLKYSIGEESPMDDLPAKAASRLRTAERDFGRVLYRKFGIRDSGNAMTPTEFTRQKIRPITEHYLKTGEIDAEIQNLFDSLTVNKDGTPAAESKEKRFDSAAETFTSVLRSVAEYSAERRAAQAERKNTVSLPVSAEEAIEAQAKRDDLRREKSRVMAKVVLSAEDELMVGKLLRGEISEDQLDSSRYNVEDILKAYEVKKKFEEADDAVKLNRKKIDVFKNQRADRYLETSDQWKDKKTGIRYTRETMERNLYDIIPDQKVAEQFFREYFSPIEQSEAKKKIFVKKYKDRIRALGLTSEESMLVQMIGEAEDNIDVLRVARGTLPERDGKNADEWKRYIDDLKKEHPNADFNKIDGAIREFRTVYDELIEKINEVRAKNGLAVVPYRKNYFPHFGDDDQQDSVIAKVTRGLGMRISPVQSSPYSGSSLQDSPYFGHAKRRTSEVAAEFDALKGFEDYIEGAGNVIFHTDNVRNLRILANRLRRKMSEGEIQKRIDAVNDDQTIDDEEKNRKITSISEEAPHHLSGFASYLDEYTNVYAGKKSTLDRIIDNALGGNALYELARAAENRVGANLIVGNLGSALTNFYPLVQAQAVLSDGIPLVRGNYYILRGAIDTTTALLKDDGLAQESVFLTNRRGDKPLVSTFGETIADYLSKPMELIDRFVSESVFRAAYLKNKDADMSEEEAIYQADRTATSIMADRSKGAAPVLFASKSPLVKAFTKFQLEPNNELSVIFKDIPRRKDDEKTGKYIARVFGTFVGYFLFGSLVFDDLFEKLVGRRPGFDPLSLLNDTVGEIFGYRAPNTIDLIDKLISGELSLEDFETERGKLTEALGTLGKEAVSQVPFIGSYAGGGRIPVSAALPDFAKINTAITSPENIPAGNRLETIGDELAKPLLYATLPAGGGFLKNVLTGIRANIRNGVYGYDYGKNGGEYLKYPVYDDLQDQLNAIAFGPNYTTGGQKWTDSGFRSLSVKQTAAYEALRTVGIQDKEAYQFITDFRGESGEDVTDKEKRETIRESDLSDNGKFVAYYTLMASTNQQVLMHNLIGSGDNLGEITDVLMDIQDIPKGISSTSAEKCRILLRSGLSDDSLRTIYADKISDSDIEDINRVLMTNLNFRDYLEAKGMYESIQGSRTSAVEKGIEFSQWIDEQPYTDAEADAIKDVFSMKSSKKYSEYTSLGISDDYAAKLVRAVDALEPLPGEKSISSIQKARVVVDTISDADDRLAALGTVLSESQYRKVSIAADAGLDPEVWVAFREILPEFDSDGSGSYTQAEMEDAIRAFSNGSNYGTTLMKAARNLSRDEMAILWQIGGSWKSASNPFSKTTGKKVKDLLDAEKKGKG